MEECAASMGKGIYPFGELKVGESFSYPLLRSSEEKNKQRNALAAAIRKYKERTPNTEFVFRLLDREGVIRVWRVKADFFSRK